MAIFLNILIKYQHASNKVWRCDLPGSKFDPVIRAVLLNMDGVLMNSESYICPAEMEMFREKGFIVPDQDFTGFINRCKEQKLLTALVSSANPIKIKTLLREIDMETGMFHCIISGLDVVDKKPSPDIFNIAARRLGVAPEECLIVEEVNDDVLNW